MPCGDIPNAPQSEEAIRYPASPGRYARGYQAEFAAYAVFAQWHPYVAGCIRHKWKTRRILVRFVPLTVPVPRPRDLHQTFVVSVCIESGLFRRVVPHQ